MNGGRKGLLISFEGTDGAGKSTQAEILATRIRSLGRAVVVTREPGGTEGAERIRQLLLDGGPAQWSPMTEMLLFCAARRDHVERLIRPALEADKVVLCDRFHDSTEVYQAAGGGVATEITRRMHAMAIDCYPDLTLVMRLAPEAAAMRCARRETGHNRFEKRGDAFRARIEAGYRRLLEDDPERCRAIDASGGVDAVAKAIWEVVAPALTPAPGNG